MYPWIQNLSYFLCAHFKGDFMTVSAQIEILDSGLLRKFKSWSKTEWWGLGPPLGATGLGHWGTYCQSKTWEVWEALNTRAEVRHIWARFTKKLTSVSQLFFRSMQCCHASSQAAAEIFFCNMKIAQSSSNVKYESLKKWAVWTHWALAVLWKNSGAFCFTDWKERQFTACNAWIFKIPGWQQKDELQMRRRPPCLTFYLCRRFAVRYK